MTIEQAERYLLGLELFGMRFGLERMRRLLTALGSPQERFAAIHVVGTNGKSSTVRMAAALLEAHGVRAGAFLSPHLTSFASFFSARSISASSQARRSSIRRTAAPRSTASDGSTATAPPGIATVAAGSPPSLDHSQRASRATYPAVRS